MIKLKLLFGLTILCAGQILSAQTFMEADPPPPFEGVAVGSIAFSDVNGDGFEDVLITGDGNMERIAKLYTNDGTGSFSEVPNTPFDGVFQSSIAFSDVNQDGFEDVLITGMNNASMRLSTIYTNDGLGNFTELAGTPFDAVFAGSVAFADVNGDGTSDVLITGDNNGQERIAKLYTNDGMGNFSEVIGTPFVGVAASSVAFSDVDGNGSQDVIISGIDSSDQGATKMYLNDGMGNFTEFSGTPFLDVIESSVGFSDINGDGHQDIFISGQGTSSDIDAKFYLNDGAGGFTEIADSPVDGVSAGGIVFADFDGDGDEDLLISGLTISNERIAKLFSNDGTGSFSEVMDTPFEGVVVSTVASSDVNDNGKNDVIIAGFSTSNALIAKLYINEGNPNSTIDRPFDLEMNTSLYPNPTTSTTLNVNLNATESGIVSIKIIDHYGRVVSRMQRSIGSGQQTLTIDTPQLAPANYFIHLETGNQGGTTKFTVQ